MTALELGKKLVEMCREGRNREAIETLYAPDVVSVEAAPLPTYPAEVRSREDVLGKGQWWSENHIIHSTKVEGPFPHGDRFVVRFWYDVTNKQSNARFQMDEAALFTVKDGKVVHEQFFYVTG